jgi:putative transposase
MKKHNKIFDDRMLPLETGQYYHIFNKGNNKDKLFTNDENYRYFMKLYAKYLSDFVDTFAYCLLPNHFHFLIRIKEIKDLQSLAYFVSLYPENKENCYEQITNVISDKFRLFFMSYAKAFNKQENRQGSLFKKYFRRKRIDDYNYLVKEIGYIHMNPVHHGISIDYANYPHSSYKGILSEKKTLLKRDDILNWFGGKNEFENSHQALKNHVLDKEIWRSFEE